MDIWRGANGHHFRLCLAFPAGNDPWVLGAVIAGEYVGVGMGTSASVAFIARETSRLAVATQLHSLPRWRLCLGVVSSSFSGMIVDSIGWTIFLSQHFAGNSRVGAVVLGCTV